MKEDPATLQAIADQKPYDEKEQDAFFSEKNKYKQVQGDSDKLTDGDVLVVVDEYIGPKGAGYLLKSFVRKDGVLYSKLDDKGPDGRSLDWFEVLTRESYLASIEK